MLCHWSQGIFNMVNIELFVNINNPSRLQSVMPPRNTTCSCSSYKKSEFAEWHRLLVCFCVPWADMNQKWPELMSPCTSAHPDPNNLKVKAVLLWRYCLPLWRTLGGSKDHRCMCVCVSGHVGSCATDWYHKWTIGWKVPQHQMKGRINRRGAELRWAPGVHQGRSDEEIIEKGPLPSERGRQESVGLMRSRRVVGDWMISSRELAAFPAKFPILWRGGRKAILMARRDIRIRKAVAAGSAKHNLPSNFSFTQSNTYSTF